jgi:hypothetical protein
MEELSLDITGLGRKALWDPRSCRMEETRNNALILLDQLMDRPGVNIEAFKRVADICDDVEHEGSGE